MIVHLFNSSSVSGPEVLVLPALSAFPGPCVVVNLREVRMARLRESDPLEKFCQTLNLPYESIPVNGRWDRAAMRHLQQVLERLRPALVHAHDVKASIYLQQATPHRAARRWPIVSTHHGVHVMPDWKTRAYEILYRRFFLKAFDRVLCVCHSDYQNLLASGIGEDQLRLHLNGVNRRRVNLESRSLEAQRIRALWLPEESGGDRLFLLGVVARLSPEKDHARVLRVLACLNALPCDRDWRCLIFGMGALEKKLQQAARQLGLEKRVIWMGYRNHIAEELSGLDLLLSFSRAEGLPINLIEAGWAGTPVMCTPVDGVAELIPDDQYGIRVALDEPAATTAGRMQRVLSPDGNTQLQTLGRRFQERVVKEFTQEKWLQRLAEIYSELKVDVGDPSTRAGRRTA